MDPGLAGRVYAVTGSARGLVLGTSDEDWTRSFESVFLGGVRLARAVATALDDGGALAMVLSSSVRSPMPNMAISNGLRPGLAMVAKTLADEVAPRGVRVNALLPGRVGTDEPPSSTPSAATPRPPGSGRCGPSRSAGTATPRSSAGSRRSCRPRPRRS